jgi:putative holliday junction resolvase
MRWLGVDLGRRRVGLAYSEDDEGPAAPLRTVTVAAGGEAAAVIAVAREVRAEGIVLGLPLEMSGREGLAARHARAVARAIGAALGEVPIALVDERLTSQEAHRALSASGKKRKDHASDVDQLAAKILLDTHLAMHGRAR